MSKQIEIDILSRSKKWQKHEKIEDFIEKTCQKLIKKTQINDFLQNKQNQIELSVSLVSDIQIKKINQEFRHKNKATDVLSFPAMDEKEARQKDFFKHLNVQNIFLGDIALSIDTIEKEARTSKKTFYDHLTHLILHSILHLIGFDHETDKQAQEMEEIEIEILKELKIKNPYKC